MPIVLQKSQLTSDAQMLSIRLTMRDFLRRHPEECNSSKEANQNKDSIRGCTPNVKESAGRLCNKICAFLP
jgi:hypothetical protein